jgi:hypothetical protein
MYSTKVYRAIGGDEIVVENGGKITLKTGATLTNDGDFFTSVTFDADYFTVTDGEVTLKADKAALLTIVGNIPTTDPADGASIWNDSGVLKLASSA